MPNFARRGRALLPGQRSELTIADYESGETRVLFTANEIIEAPNWTPDGAALIFNAGGELWRIPADGSAEPVRIDTGPLHDLNNDHVLSPDGQTIYVSSDDSHLYALPIGGSSTPRRVSNTHPERHHYYLHGVSPDGQTLVYTGVEARNGNSWGRVNIWTIPAAGGTDTDLTGVMAYNDGRNTRPTANGSGSIPSRARPATRRSSRCAPMVRS